VTAPSTRAKLTAVLISVVFTLALGEVGLRIAGISSPNFYRPDPVRGWGLAPDEEGWWTSEGHAWVHINHEGERDTDHAIAKPAGMLRVAILGDSCTEALQVPLEQTFWKIMEPQLRATARSRGWRDAEVLNFGVAGYGTAQELLTLREKVWRYSPDVVVLAFYSGNDVRNNQRSLEQDPSRPYFLVQPGQQGKASLLLDDSFRTTSGYRMRQSLPARILYGLFNHIRLLELGKRGQSRLDGWIGSMKARHKEKGEALQELGLDNAVYSPPHDVDWQEAWQATEGILATLNREVTAKGARFGLLSLTTPIQVHPDPVARERFMAKLGVTSLGYPDARLAQVSANDGFPFLALAPLLQPIAQGQHVFLHGFANTTAGEGHWNAAGHRAAAPYVADWIGREVLRPTANPVGFPQ
jgi:hypothetical protein